MLTCTLKAPKENRSHEVTVFLLPPASTNQWELYRIVYNSKKIYPADEG